MKSILILAGAALLAATGALAAEGEEGNAAATTETAATQDEAKQEPVQCRYERVTGSRTKAYKICLTRQQWAQRSTREGEELEKLRSANTMGPASGFGGT